MRKILALFTLFLPSVSSAVCTQKTSGLRLCIPNYNDNGSTYGVDLQTALNVINSSPVVNGTSAQMELLQVSTIAARSTNPQVYVSTRVGILEQSPKTPLSVNGGDAITLNGVSGFALFGSTSGNHVAISNGAIQFKSDPTTAGTFQINSLGGNVAVGTTTATSLLTVFNGDIEISTNTGTRGLKFQTGRTQYESGAQLVSEVTLAASVTTYQFTGLDSLSDKGYIIEFSIRNATTTAVGYNLTAGTFTASANWESERLINNAAALTPADDANNQFALSAGSGQPVGGKIDIYHIGDEVLYHSRVRDGTRGAGSRRAIYYDGNVTTGVVATFNNIKLEASVANGLGAGTVLRLYRKR